MTEARIGTVMRSFPPASGRSCSGSAGRTGSVQKASARPPRGAFRKPQCHSTFHRHNVTLEVRGYFRCREREGPGVAGRDPPVPGLGPAVRHAGQGDSSVPSGHGRMAAMPLRVGLQTGQASYRRFLALSSKDLTRSESWPSLLNASHISTSSSVCRAYSPL